MKYTIILIFIAFNPFISFAGDGAGNGGGIGEKNMAFAFHSLSENIAACLESNKCELDGSEREILQKINATLKSKQETYKQVEFHSEKNEPDFFILNGVIRSARTGDNIGSKIFINIDHLYKMTNEGTTQPIDVITATSLLVHELSHHHGIGNGGEELIRMDILCAKLSSFLSSIKDHLSYKVTNNVMGLFYKRQQDMKILTEQMKEFIARDFLKACDPTDGEDKEIRDGCESVYDSLQRDLLQNRSSNWWQYRISTMHLEPLMARYQFVRPLEISSHYGCEIRVEVSVTLKDELKDTYFDMYCDG